MGTVQRYPKNLRLRSSPDYLSESETLIDFQLHIVYRTFDDYKMSDMKFLLTTITSSNDYDSKWSDSYCY